MSIEIISDTESNPADASTNDAAADTVETVRILGTSTCRSLSGKSTLTYTIAMDTEGQSQIALLCNDGRGYLNTDAIAFKDIQAELAKQPKEITSGSLRCLYPNKSNNSPGFFLAVFKAVGLVQVSTTNPRCYEGKLSADALGLTVCLYAFSNLSFGEGDFAALCGQHY